MHWVPHRSMRGLFVSRATARASYHGELLSIAARGP